MKRTIGLSTAVFLVVASMVGTGVFTTSGLLLADMRSVPAVLVAWGVGGVLAMTGALSYAELVAALPENGGEYHLVGTAFHPALGFATGFVSFVVGFSAPIATSALAFGEYAHAIWPAIPQTPVALVLIGFMGLVHAGRMRLGGGVQNILTGFKVLLIVGVIALGAFFVVPERLLFSERPVLAASTSPQFAVALVYVSFAYTGWNAAAYVAGEVKNPKRTIPLALILGTLIVTVLYLGINAVFLGVAPAEELSGQVEVGHIAAVHILPGAAGNVLSGIIAFGLISTVGALIMTGTRVLEAMGRDHDTLSLLASRASGGGPFASVALLSITAATMVVVSDFRSLLGYVGFTLSIFAALTVLGVIVMRIRQPDLVRPYRTLGYPITPIVFVGLMVWMIVHSIFQEPSIAIAGACTIAAGLVLYAVLRALETSKEG